MRQFALTVTPHSPFRLPLQGMKLPTASCETFGEGAYCGLEAEGQEGGLIMDVETLEYYNDVFSTNE